MAITMAITMAQTKDIMDITNARLLRRRQRKRL
jgi:hypothetical protein